MTTDFITAKPAKLARRPQTIDNLLDQIRHRTTHLAEARGLRNEDNLVATRDCSGWLLTCTVPNKGAPVQAGFPIVVLTKGERKIEMHFPTIEATDCNLTRTNRTIVIRKGKVESDNGTREDQAVEDLLEAILSLIPAITIA